MYRLTTNCVKSYCNRTLIVKVIVENVVTCFFWDTVWLLHFSVVTLACKANDKTGILTPCRSQTYENFITKI